MLENSSEIDFIYLATALVRCAALSFYFSQNAFVLYFHFLTFI